MEIGGVCPSAVTSRRKSPPKASGAHLGAKTRSWTVPDQPGGALWGCRGVRGAPRSEVVQPERSGRTMSSEVDLDEDPPAPGPAEPVVVVKRPAQEATERALDVGVRWARRRQHGHLSAQDLRPHVVAEVQQLVVRSELVRCGHDRIVTERAGVPRAQRPSRPPIHSESSRSARTLVAPGGISTRRQSGPHLAPPGWSADPIMSSSSTTMSAS